MESNPFTDIYTALWKLAERNEKLRIYFPEGNRGKYKEVGQPKHTVSSADRPELTLIPGGGKVNIRNTNTTTALVRTYSWAITTDSFKLFDPFEVVGWELLRAMVDYDKVLCALKWEGEYYLKNATTIDINEGLVEPNEQLGIKGWSAIWACELEFHFATANLRLKVN